MSGRKGCVCFFVELKVYFQEEDSCLSQIDSPAVPLTVFSATPAAPDMTHIEVTKGQFKFYTVEHCVLRCVTPCMCVNIRQLLSSNSLMGNG